MAHCLCAGREYARIVRHRYGRGILLLPAGREAAQHRPRAHGSWMHFHGSLLDEGGHKTGAGHAGSHGSLQVAGRDYGVGIRKVCSPFARVYCRGAVVLRDVGNRHHAYAARDVEFRDGGGHRVRNEHRHDGDGVARRTQWFVCGTADSPCPHPLQCLWNDPDNSVLCSGASPRRHIVLPPLHGFRHGERRRIISAHRRAHSGGTYAFQRDYDRILPSVLEAVRPSRRICHQG